MTKTFLHPFHELPPTYNQDYARTAFKMRVGLTDKKVKFDPNKGRSSRAEPIWSIV